MKTIGEIVRLSIAHVQSKGGRPRHEVEELIAQTLSMRRLDLYLNFDRPLEEAEAAKIRGPLHLLASGKPLAYVLGKAHFYGFEFSVTPAVLIPRPETELLVTTAKAFMSSRSPGILVDVCTGSGCVGLTLKALFPDWHVVLTDISREALAVAKSNARRLNLTVDLLCGDLLKPFLGRAADCIVANPPYLSSSEWEALDHSVAAYEPKIALEAGPEGIECYQRLFRDLPSCLVPQGFCAVEIGASQAAAVQSLAQNVGSPALLKDLSGFDRVITVTNVISQ